MAGELQISGLPSNPTPALTDKVPTDNASDVTYKNTWSQILSLFLTNQYNSVNQVTANTYNVGLADNNTFIDVLNSTGGLAISLPQQSSVALSEGFSFWIMNTGVADATFSVSGSDSLLGAKIVPSGVIAKVTLVTVLAGVNTWLVGYQEVAYSAVSAIGNMTLSSPLKQWHDITPNVVNPVISMPDVRFGAVRVGESYMFRNVAGSGLPCTLADNNGTTIVTLNAGEAAILVNTINNANVGSWKYIYLGSMSAQSASNVAITGGTISVPDNYDAVQTTNYTVLFGDRSKVIPCYASSPGFNVTNINSSSVSTGFYFYIMNVSTAAYITFVLAAGDAATLEGPVLIPPGSIMRVTLTPTVSGIGSAVWVTAIYSNALANVNAQTGTTYTLTPQDFTNGIVTLNNASPVTVTIPQASSTVIAKGGVVNLINIGFGTVTIAKSGSDTLQGNTTLLRNAAASIVCDVAGSPNTFSVVGGSTTTTYQFDLYIQNVANGTYYFTPYAGFPGTLTEISGLVSTGSCTVTVNINGSAVTGTPLSATTGVTEQAITGANTFNSGSNITAVVSSNSSAANLALTLWYTRVQ